MVWHLIPSLNIYTGAIKQTQSFVLFSHGKDSSVYQIKAVRELEELENYCVRGFSSPETELARWLITNNLVEEIDEVIWNSAKVSMYSREIAGRAITKGINAACLIQNYVEQASVAIIGVGGLGSHIAQYLARIGVSKFVLVDFDVVEKTNLNRQVLYKERDIGSLKVECAAQELGEINNNISVETMNDVNEFIQRKNTSLSVVFVSADNDYFGLRNSIVTHCWSEQVPYIFAGYTGSLVRIHPAVTNFNDGCGMCIHDLTKGAVKYQTFSAVDSENLISPSSYAINSFGAILAVERWFSGIGDKQIQDYSVDADWPTLDKTNYIPPRSDKCTICGDVR